MSVFTRLVGRLTLMVSPLSRRERLAQRQAMETRQLGLLEHELKQKMLTGEPVGPRRLKTLVLAAGTSRRKTIRLLKKLGARRCPGRKEEFWILE